MGYLSHIVLALAAIVAADFDVTTGWHLWPASALLLPLPHLLGRWVRAWSLEGGFRRAAVGLRVLTIAPPVLQIVAVCVFGWHDAVRSWVGAGLQSSDWPEPALLLSLLPFLLYEGFAIDARARLFDSRPREVANMRRFQLRMFLSGVVPLAIYLGLAGLVALDPSVRAHVEEVGLLNAAFAGASIGLFAMFLPSILRNTWDTAPIEPGPTRAVLDAVAARARFRCKEMRVWRTGHLMANAAVVGFHPRHRVVLFSDSLLAQLGPRELGAVFGHEIGHAKRHHVLVFAAWTLAFFLLADIGAGVLELGEGTWLGALGALCVAWYLGFGYLSRRFELDADLVSYELTGDGDALVHALEEVGGPHARGRSSWRHFSIAHRVLFLRALFRDPEVGVRLRRSLRIWVRVGYGALVLTLIAEGVLLTQRWAGDMVAVDLRLGRYGSAVARLDRMDNGSGEASVDDTRFRDAVGRAAEAAGPDAELTPAELDVLAGGALDGGRLAESLDWLELGARRGLTRHRELWLRLTDAIETEVGGQPFDPGAYRVLLHELATRLREPVPGTGSVEPALGSGR